MAQWSRALRQRIDGEKVLIARLRRHDDRDASSGVVDVCHRVPLVWLCGLRVGGPLVTKRFSCSEW